ncbi:MAG: DUF1573 domain-containing protein [Janthinobacterium lividum]
MKKTLLLALGLTFAGAAAHAQTTMAPTAKVETPAKKGKTPRPDGPQVEFAEVKFDFGTIKQGDIVDHVFKFKNIGRQPLVISNIGVSCGCTTPTWTKEPVAPGKTGTISAKFNSAGKMGLQTKVLTIESNSAGGSTTVSLVGEVKDAAAAQSTTAPKS